MNGAPKPLAAGPTTIVAARAPRWVSVSVVLVATFVAIAAMKPWGGGAKPARTDASVPAIQLGEHAAVRTSDTFAAAPTRPPGPAEMICGRPLGWRVVSSGLWQGQPSSASIAVTPVSATRAIDGRIPFVVADGDRVDELGWCAPPTGDAQEDDATVIAWRLGEDGSETFALRPVGTASASRMAGLYTPATAPPSSPWPAGRYVFRVDRAGDAAANWFGVEVRIQPLR